MSERPLRIGINARCLEEAHTRGLSRYTSCLLRALSCRPDVELVLFGMQPPHPSHMAGIRARVVCFTGRETAWQDRLLPARMRAEEIDVFHAPADRGVPLGSPCPCVVTVHDSYERTHWRTLFPSWRQRAWYWKNELANRVGAGAVLTVSETTRRALLARHVTRAARLRTIRLAAAEEFSAVPTPDDESIVNRARVRQPYVLYVGGYDPRKNVDALVHAFDRARPKTHALVIIARKDRQFEALLPAWRSLACFPRMSFLEVENAALPAFYRHADLFVNPSLWESFSFQLVEAMASGTPVLASDRQAIPEIANGAADLVNTADVGALATRMSALLANDGRLAELREKGLVRATAFSWPRTALETLGVYAELAAGRRVARGRA